MAINTRSFLKCDNSGCHINGYLRPVLWLCGGGRWMHL